MTEELNNEIAKVKKLMNSSIDHFIDEMSKLRAGKAAPQMVDTVTVDYYGALTPLNQMASVNAPDPRTLVIQPWDKNMIEPIEKAIINSNLGFNPQNDGDLIRINIPPLTEERRKELVRYTKTEAEKARVSIRNARKEFLDTVKQMLKDGLSEDDGKLMEEKIQNITNEFSSKVDSLLKNKEEEILKV